MRSARRDSGDALMATERAGGWIALRVGDVEGAFRDFRDADAVGRSDAAGLKRAAREHVWGQVFCGWDGPFVVLMPRGLSSVDLAGHRTVAMGGVAGGGLAAVIPT